MVETGLKETRNMPDEQGCHAAFDSETGFESMDSRTIIQFKYCTVLTSCYYTCFLTNSAKSTVHAVCGLSGLAKSQPRALRAEECLCMNVLVVE